MRKLFFFEKKTEFADAARRLYRYLTEYEGMHEITELKILRTVIVTAEEPFSLPREAVRVLYEEETETEIPEKTVREETAGGVSLCVLPFFERQEEHLVGEALRRVSGTDGISVRCACLYLVFGVKGDAAHETLRKILANPAANTEISLWEGGMLPPEPPYREYYTARIRGFREAGTVKLAVLSQALGLGMSEDDLRFVQSYYKIDENREPNLLELRFADIYWSERCRRKTFRTALEDLRIGDGAVEKAFRNYLGMREALYGTRPKAVTLSDILSVPYRYFRKEGCVPFIGESREKHTAFLCADIRVKKGNEEPVTERRILYLRNESHDGITNRVPFIGAGNGFSAAVCGAASLRSTVFAAMRLSGSGGDTLFGTENDSADGSSAIGAACGVPLSSVRTFPHPGYTARHMEVCMTAAAVRAEEQQEKEPVPGDVVLLIGAKTGCAGIGTHSFGAAGDPVQAADPAAARAIVRFFAREDTAAYVKRTADARSGGIGAAAAELAEGVRIDLDRVPTAGELSAVESPYAVTVSETGERILLAVSANRVPAIQRIAEEEGLTAVSVGVVTAERRFRMMWRDRTVLNLSRDFLDSAGAEKRISAVIPHITAENLYRGVGVTGGYPGENITELYCRALRSPETCAQTGVFAHVDAAAGGRTVLWPFGGKRRLTPPDYAAVRFPTAPDETTSTCALFSSGFSPSVSETSPYHGGYLAVLEALCRLAASGKPTDRICLSLQGYFPAVNGDPERFGIPLASALGAFQAQADYGVSAVGGGESMSGSTENADVPPTLIAFGAMYAEEEGLLTPEFKKSGSRVYLLDPARGEDGLPEPGDERGLLRYLAYLASEDRIFSCIALGAGGTAAGIAKMCFGNHIGFNYEGNVRTRSLFEAKYGAFLVETEDELRGTLIGYTKDSANILFAGHTLPLDLLADAWQTPQRKLYGDGGTEEDTNIVAAFPYRGPTACAPAVYVPHPTVLLPVFPGSAGEETLAARFAQAGITPKRFLFRAGNPEETENSCRALADAIGKADVLAFTGSGSADNGRYSLMTPDASRAVVSAVFRDPRLSEAVSLFMKKGNGLALGMGDGFRMLLAAGFFDENGEQPPFLLTENRTGRPASGLVRVRIMSVRSPWMRFSRVGDEKVLPVSSRAGRCLIPGDAVLGLAEAGRIASQYVNEDSNPAMDPRSNPFFSDFAVEGIFSRDGRVFGRMAQSDRIDPHLCINVPGDKDDPLFRSAADYFALHG